MHLIQKKHEGIKIPTLLPASLVPPSKRANITSPFSPQGVLLEEHNREMRERQGRAATERAEAESSQADGRGVMEVSEGDEAVSRSSQSMDGIEWSASVSVSSPPQVPPVQETATTVERTGLCVICQDDVADIVVLDCGYVLVEDWRMLLF